MTEEQARQAQAAKLLRDVLDELAGLGFRRVAVDRWAGHDFIVGHHYTGGVWELKVTRPDGSSELIEWGWRDNPLPDINQIIGQIRGPVRVWPEKETTKA